jgi:glycosyltransferase involved in cell wall biosynthesis
VKPEFDVILPVLDERAALPGVLASIPVGFRAIVVDNGSTDGSGPLAASLGAVVVDEPKRGFGAACFAGLLRAEADVVCFMDCDGSLDGADLLKVTGPVVAGKADLVMGRRRASRGAWPVHARVANVALGAALKARHHVRVRDIGPMRAAGRLHLLELGIVDRRFGWPLEMVVRAADAGWRIVEVDVPYHPRQGGQSKVTGTLKGTLRTVRDMGAVLR